MGGFYFLKQEEKEEHVLHEMVQKQFTSWNHTPSGEPRQKCHSIFIEKLLLILGDCANQFLFFFPFLLVPSPITLPGVYFIFICSTKRVSSLGGTWAQLDKYVYVDFPSILPSKESSVTNLLNLSKLLLSKCQ